MPRRIGAAAEALVVRAFLATLHLLPPGRASNAMGRCLRAIEMNDGIEARLVGCRP